MPQRTTKGLLLAGGLGTRLRPITDITPKCLIQIAGRPLLSYWIDRLVDCSVREILINTHHLPNCVRSYIQRVNSSGRMTAREAYEPTLLGSAGTIHQNRNWADDADDIVVIYADNLSQVNLNEFLDFHRGHSDPLTMLLFHADNPRACGIVQLDDKARIIDFVEKPKEPQSDLANGGVYAMTAEAYREIADMNAIDLGFDVLPKFVGRMGGFVYQGYHRDIGTLAALRQAEADAFSWSD
jgi:mannose-1-phosphate guanylyltransferase